MSRTQGNIIYCERRVCVLQNVTNEEPCSGHYVHNANMSSEQNRRESFRYCRQKMKIETLVKSGFYFIGEKDYVRCFFCGIGLGDFNPNDDPFVEHEKYNRYCQFIAKITQKKTSFTYEDLIQENNESYLEEVFLKHPEMEAVKDRIETFENKLWQDNVARNQLVYETVRFAKAGFFFAGTTDVVVCHSCNGHLKHWEPCDDPWIEHCRWFPECPFIRRKIKMTFIKSCIRGKIPSAYENWKESRGCMKDVLESIKHAVQENVSSQQPRSFSSNELQASASETPDAEENDVSVIPNRKLCRICQHRPICLVFVPCGHKIMCEDCAVHVKLCMHCDTPVHSKIKNICTKHEAH